MQMGNQVELKTKTNWHPNAFPLKNNLEINFNSKRNEWKPHTKISRQQLPSIKSPKGIELDSEDLAHSSRRLLVKQGNKNQKV
jgi:hypothetical protein